MGASGTFTQEHIDNKDNFVYQLIGQKQWTIYPPRDYHCLYYTKERGSLEWSKVLNSRDSLLFSTLLHFKDPQMSQMSENIHFTLQDDTSDTVYDATW